MEVKILGPGCHKCNSLENAVREVVREMGLDIKIEKVTDINEIADTGVLLTPGLVINGKIKSSGKVIGRELIKKYLKEEL